MRMRIGLIVLYLLTVGVCGRYLKANKISGQTLVSKDNDGGELSVNVGVIVDMGSWMGKVVRSCIIMAISDFYKDHSHYRTRIRLHVRDSNGDSLHSVAAALDLLENVQVHAMIVPIISTVELFMANLGDKANVPMLSFSSMSLLDAHPYFLQIGGDEVVQFVGIADLGKSFKWKSCVSLFEDTVDGTNLQPVIYNILQENHLRVAYQIPISITATDDQIVNELHKLVNMKASIVIVHLSTSLASQVFVNAEKLGMISEGYAWIVTSKSMNFLNFEDSSVYESMQGVLGFRSHIPASSKLQNFTLRWRREFPQNESTIEIKELNVHGTWAYDAVWALAEAVERAGTKPSPHGVQCNILDSSCSRVSESGLALLSEISKSNFTGVAGEYGFVNGKKIPGTYEIVNILGKGERRVGYWTSTSGLSKENYRSTKFSSNSTLETIIWPGISVTTPETQLVRASGNKLRVGIPPGNKRPELIHWVYDQQTNVTNAYGYCVDVFAAAFNWLGHNMSFEYIPHFNRNYNDLIYQVYQGNYDVALGDITIFSNRSRFVDFTIPFTELGVGVVAKLDSKDPWFFTKPFDRDLWIVSALFFLGTGVLIWLIERPYNEEFQGPPARQVGTLLWFAVSTLVYAHRERLHSNLSRFVMGTWLFVVLILTSSYTANLSSILTVQRFKLAKHESIGSANPLIEGLTVSNLNFKDSRLMPYQSVEDYVEALGKGSKKGGVGAIVDEIPYIEIFLAKYPQHYAMIHSKMTTNGFGIAFPKGSPLVQELSRAIAGLREEGKLLMMKKKWFASQTLMFDQENQPPSGGPLKIHCFLGLFLVSGISKSIAILILVSFLVRERVSRMYMMLKGLAIERIISIKVFIHGMGQAVLGADDVNVV